MMTDAFAALLFLAIASGELFACICAGPLGAKNMREVAEWYMNQSDIKVIFEGKVIKQEIRAGWSGAPSTAMSLTPSGRLRVVDFTVTRTFKGENHGQISVLTGLGTGDCGYDFQTGSTYLVYASAGPQGIWFTSICTGTTAIEDAGTALRLLSGEKPIADDLLSPEEHAKQYFEKVLPKRSGSVCGHALKPDNTPLKGANVELWEQRNDDLPAHSADDPNTSRDDGHFCIDHATLGRYLLTAESTDYDHNSRYMAFYPGVEAQEQAVPLEMRAGVRLPDVNLTTVRQRLYTIRIRVVTSDGSKLSCTGVAVNSPYRDPLSYHIDGGLEDDGTYTFGYIPAGTYQVVTYFEQEDDDKPCSDASRWKSAQKEALVSGDTEVVITMEPLKP